MIKLFTHTDLDGIGCAVLMKMAQEQHKLGKLDIEFCDYDNVNDKVADYIHNHVCDLDMIIITDISISEELAEEINSMNNIFKVLLDHHPTALNLNKYDWCKVQIENEDGIKTCGTELLYKYLSFMYRFENPESVSSFVDIVRDYDTWAWASKGENGLISKKVNDLFHLYGRDKFIDWAITNIEYNYFPVFSDADEAILETNQTQIDSYIEQKNDEMIKGYLLNRRCGFVIADRYISELGNKLCKMNEDIGFIVMVSPSGLVSYRSVKNDIDLGRDIAKAFGGGGHPLAAGSQFNIDLLKNLFNAIFYYKASFDNKDN